MIKDRHSKAPKVVIFGVGGAGVSTINRIFAKINNTNNVNLVVVDTNPQTIKDSTAQKRIIANDNFAKNFSGSTYAYAAALGSKEDIVNSLNGASIAFVIYGAGGEAGSNISIAIIEFAKKLEILTVALSTEPFLFEDGKRILEASSCLSIMNKTSDLQFIIDNDKLIQTSNRNKSLIDGFKMVDRIWIEIINSSINFMDTHFCFSPNADEIKEAVGGIGTNLLVDSGHIKEKMLFKFKKTTEITNNTYNVETKETHTDNQSRKQINHWDDEIKGKVVTPGSNWDLLRKSVMKRDDYKCSSCGSTSNLTIDHRMPLSLGGTNDLSNLQTLCRDCHEDKHYCNFLDKKFDANDDYGANYRLSNKIQTIIGAVNNKSKVKINYVDREGIKSLRIISPKKIYKGYRYQGKIVCINCVYVDAYCEKDRDDRTFRLSRMGTIDNI